MKPMKIKAYIRWKRDEAFKRRDLLDAQKRVARAKAFFEDAMEDHVLNQSKITIEQVQRCAVVFLETPDNGSIEIIFNNPTSAKIIDDLDCLDDELFKSSLSRMLINDLLAAESSFLCHQINLPQTFVRMKKFANVKTPGLIPELINHKHDV